MTTVYIQVNRYQISVGVVYSRHKYILDETVISRDPNFAKFGKDGIRGENSNLIYRTFFLPRALFIVHVPTMHSTQFRCSFTSYETICIDIILNFEYINCNFKLYKSLSYAQDVKIFDLIIKLIPVLYCTGNNLFLSIKEMFLTSGACAYHGEIKTFNL